MPGGGASGQVAHTYATWTPVKVVSVINLSVLNDNVPLKSTGRWTPTDPQLWVYRCLLLLRLLIELFITPPPLPYWAMKILYICIPGYDSKTV